MNRYVLTLLLLAMPLFGCSGVSERPAQSVPTLELKDPVRIGGADDREEYQFTRIGGAAIAPDGRILLSDGGLKELRVYDGQGTFLRRMGREGEGPGEFKGISAPTLTEDGRFAAWDFQAHRLTYFTHDGQLSESVPLRLETEFPVLAQLVGILSDGSLVVREQAFGFRLQHAEPGPRVDSTAVHFVAPDGTIHQTLMIPEPAAIVWRDGGAWGSEDPIFSSELFFAVRGDRLLVVDSDSLVIHAYAPDGSATRAANITPRQPATRRLVEAERARLASERIRNGETRRASEFRTREQLRERARRAADRVLETPAKDSIPVLGDLRVGNDQSLWVRGYTLPEDTAAVWVELTDSLHPTRQFRLPLHETLLAIGHGRIVTKAADELGLETAYVYHIVDGDPTPPGGDAP